MGRPLGMIRSLKQPYAAIKTAEENDAPTAAAVADVYAGLSFEKDDDEEQHPYVDEAHDESGNNTDNNDNIATQSRNLQHHLDISESRTNERNQRMKILIFLSVLIGMVILGKEYYTDGSSNVDIEDGLFTEEGGGGEGGVRGKSQPCQDDPNFVYNNKSCAKYVGKIDEIDLLQTRCSKKTGSGIKHVGLFVKDFCKQSCGLCDDNSNNNGQTGSDFSEDEKEIIKEQIQEEVEEGMLEANEVEELATAEMGSSKNNNNAEDLINEEEYIEGVEEELEEDKEFLNEDIKGIAEKIAEAQADDDGVLAEEKEEYIETLEEEYIEDSEIEEKVESVEGELESVENLEEMLEEGVETNELGEEDNEEEGTEGEGKDEVVVGEDDYIPDYFIPLTSQEREQMKDKLRETLLRTKNALRMSANLKDGAVVTDSQRTLVLSTTAPKQFMHMHHMKTAGTTIDGLISCALNRQKLIHGGTAIKYNQMSECGSRVHSCMVTLAGKLDATLTNNVFYHNDENGSPIADSPFDPADEELNNPINEMNICQTSESNVMSYCASLHAVRTFGWKDVDKITVIRNPIDRAWSMYKFTLNGCYKCQELKDVLQQIHSGSFGNDDVANFIYEPNNSCAVQLIGHQCTNLLSSVDLYNVANDVRFPREKEIVEEAVRNLRNQFTWIGITDRLEESVAGFRQIFPFLSEDLKETANIMKEEFQKRGEELEDYTFALPDGFSNKNSCPLDHKNAGRDPTCGTNELDEETKKWIMKLNNRDMAVYKAAVERFEIQMEVLQEYRDGVL